MPKAYHFCRLLSVIVLLFVTGYSISAKEEQRYVFFLHNRFLEELPLDAVHPEYGRCEYAQILKRFSDEGFTVISELRLRNAAVDVYAQKVSKQVDSLLKNGVKAKNITVVGTSKGGFIAMNISNILRNKDINFVIVGSCWDSIATEIPDLKLYGNILSIYEKSDRSGQSCHSLEERSAGISTYKEIELYTGFKHGYLYKALDAWMEPAMSWGRQRDSVENELTDKIQALIEKETATPFNGIIIIAQNGATRYVKCNGYSDMENKKPLQMDDRFIIGSVSKQITAVLILREFDNGHLKLDDPIKKYLPDLEQKWADKITVHQLLTHTHGIPEPNYRTDSNVKNLPDTLYFVPGTNYTYSQIGYKLLADIIEKTSGKPFEVMADDLFRLCNMNQTHHPALDTPGHVVKAYFTDTTTTLQPEKQIMPPMMVPAGGFNSSALDLLTWNECLHSGKLLKPATYKLMMTQHKNAIRQHPMFGPTAYGYGITVDNNQPVQMGQTGFFPGYASMDFYYPETKTSVIVLSNIIYGPDSKTRFQYHTGILGIIKEWLKK